MCGFQSDMIKTIKTLQARISKSKDGRTLASNFGYLMLLQIAGYVFPLLTIPYLARVIGVEGFGRIAFAAAVIVWFQTVSDWGFNYTATRDVAQNRENPEKVSEIFSNVLWARILLMVLSFGLLLVAVEVIPYFHENQTILLLTFLLVPGHIMFPDWFFQAMERMKYITIFNLISKALFSAMVFIFIKEKEDYLLQPVLMSLGYFACGVFSMYLIFVKWRVKLHAPDWRQIWGTIKSSTDVFVNNIMPNLYNSFSIVLLGFYGGNISNGLLDAGRKLVDIAQQLLMVISRVFFPFLSRKINKHGLFVRIQLGLSVIFVIALSAAAPHVIDVFFTPEFEPAVLVLQIMALSIVFISLSNIYGTNYMIIKGHERALRNITVVVSLIGFAMAFPLIRYFDYIGAAITIASTRALLGGAVMLKARQINKHELLV